MPGFHPDAQTELTKIVTEFQTKLTHQSEEIADNRSHNQVQTVDVIQATHVLAEQTKKRRIKEIVLIFSQILLGFAASEFWHSLNVTSPATIDKNAVVAWAIAVFVSAIVTVVGVMT